MSNKIGFWPVLALVVGSQIGSGVFMLPTSLAPFGIYSISGWIVSGLGAIALALVFASLCAHFPKTGGPHVYVMKLLGNSPAFFTGWTYWVVSWISSTTVIVAAIGYLSPLIGDQSAEVYLVLEIALLVFICCLNVMGVGFAGKAETVFTILKFLPLLIVPVAAIGYFNLDNFQISEKIASQPTSSTIAQATLLTLWGFIGVESATTPAGSVKNPSKTIPRALIIGTLLVAAIYIFNSISIMGLVPGSELATSSAPYVLAAKCIFSGNWYVLISVAAAIVCIGTLNAWILTSGQIALGLAEDKMFPKFFKKKNSNQAPYVAVILSCIGIVPLLFLTANKNLATQIVAFVDYSVTSFLFVYLLCSIVNLILSWRERSGLFNIINSFVATCFCLWVIAETPLNTLAISSIFTLSGLPLFYFWYKPSLLTKEA